MQSARKPWLRSKRARNRADALGHQARGGAARLGGALLYLAENAGLEVAERFLSRAEASFADLARQPMLGAPVMRKHPDLAGMRKWQVRDFDNHLVFYQPRPGGVCIVRVLHAASDWSSLLGFEA